MTEYIITVDESKTDPDGNCPISAKQEVVRCRDCKHYDTHTEPSICYREMPGRIIEPDGFCAWGVRK